MEKEQKKSRQAPPAKSAFSEWFSNPEYGPIEKVSLSSLFPLPSLPSLSQAVASLSAGFRRISRMGSISPIKNGEESSPSQAGLSAHRQENR